MRFEWLIKILGNEISYIFLSNRCRAYSFEDKNNRKFCQSKNVNNNNNNDDDDDDASP